MEIIKIISILIGSLLTMLGVIMIYDARKQTKKWFSFHDQNEGAKWFKICGFLLFVVGFVVVFLNVKQKNLYY